MVLQFKFKLLFTTAFSSKNSSLQAAGRYRLSGPIGYQAGEILVPGFAVIQSLMDSLRGISIGANGLVLAGEFRFNVGFGIEEMMAGPYYKFTTALGVSMGSSIGLIQCRGATLKIDGAFGVGVQVSQEITGALSKILDKKLKLSTDLFEVGKTLVNSKVDLPRVALCSGVQPRNSFVLGGVATPFQRGRAIFQRRARAGASNRSELADRCSVVPPEHRPAPVRVVPANTSRRVMAGVGHRMRP